MWLRLIFYPPWLTDFLTTWHKNVQSDTQNTWQSKYIRWNAFSICSNRIWCGSTSVTQLRYPLLGLHLKLKYSNDNFKAKIQPYHTWHGALPSARCAEHINYTTKESLAGYYLLFRILKDLSCELQWASGDTARLHGKYS